MNSLLTEWCSLSLRFLTQLPNYSDICLCSSGIWSLNGTSSISSSDCRVVTVLSLVLLLSLWLRLCLNICVFWKHSCLLIQARKSADRVISPTQGNNWYGRSTHRTLSPKLFSKGMVQCLVVSWHNPDPVGKRFSEHRTRDLKRKQHFHLMKPESLQT